MTRLVSPRILMMAQHYAPEQVSGAVLATQLAEDLARMGMRVTFLTAAPSYPEGKVFPGYRNSLYAVEQRQGVRVVRCWSYITPSKSAWKRVLNFLTFSISAFLAGMKGGIFDVIFCYSPPLPLGLAAMWLGLFKRIRWIFRVEDLFPDAAVASGVLRNRTLIRILLGLERYLYRRADHISLISPGFKERLVARGVPPEKISVAPVWADPAEIIPGPRQNEFRKRLGLSDEFILLYAGNLGQTAEFDDLIHAAEKLRAVPNIRFVLVGEGSRKDSLLDAIQARGLANVQVLPYQARELFPQVLAASDACLVIQNPDSAAYSLPSKVFSYMASERPIISLAPQESEVARLVKEAQCGMQVSNGDVQGFVAVIQALKDDPEAAARMGAAARRMLEDRYSRQACVQAFYTTILHYAH